MSKRVIRRQIPLLLTFVLGFLITIEWFVKWEPLQNLTSIIYNFQIVIISIMIGFAAVNLFITHSNSIRRNLSRNKQFDVFASVLLLSTLTIWLLVGLFLGTNSPTYKWLFNTFNIPLSSTAYAMTLFYLASGTYRCLRARSNETFVLMIVALITILGNVPFVTSQLPAVLTLRIWLEGVVVKAVYRAITIGVGLAAIIMSIRTFLAMETSYLGRTEE